VPPLFRRIRVAAGALLVAGLLAPASAQAISWTDADYWAAADRLQRRLDGWWVERRQVYRPGDLSADTMVNANMLLMHATAALSGHQGPARQDERAHALATRLVEAPPYVSTLSGEEMKQAHAPGWVGAMGTKHAIQHLVVDAEVAEALAVAWRARDIIRLTPAEAALIAGRLRDVARGTYWRYPTVRLNQINWYASVYTAAALTSGDTSLLQRDLRAQVRRFVRGVLHPRPGTAGNLGAGMRFHYVPARSPSWGLNLDSPEYGNLVASFARNWDAARAAGMPDISAGDKTIIRRWMTRVLTGYWTHAGYLNWDTGFGFRRLHQTKKLPLAQQGLIAIAAGGDLTPGPRYAAWAKDILDSGFRLYLRWLPEGTGLPPALLFEVSERRQPPPHAVLAAARVGANLARAVGAGLGRRAAQEAPPLYAYDPDIGRLAVTTPRYNTAIVPVNQGAFPYGGLDLARLFDGRQRVAANIGGVPPASFGMVVRDFAGRTLLATQRPRREAARGRPPLRLVRAPSGVGASQQSPPTRAFAGPFTTLEATGSVSAGSQSARSTWVFRHSSIDGRWSFRGRGTRRRTVQVQFPSWGGRDAHVWAIGRGGRREELTGPRSLRGIRWFYVQSRDSGYAIIPRGAPRGTRALTMVPARQPSAPRPGPTLLLELSRRSTARALDASVRLLPARDIAEARGLVARLR
jgi:hypothetical protein